MEKDSKIYIAGHRGMVGSAILRRLKEEGYSNLLFRSSTELDLRNQEQVKEFFNSIIIVCKAKQALRFLPYSSNITGERYTKHGLGRSRTKKQ